MAVSGLRTAEKKNLVKRRMHGLLGDSE